MIHMKLRGARRGETLHLLSFRRSRNFRLSAEPWAWIARLGGQSSYKSKRKKQGKAFCFGYWLKQSSHKFKRESTSGVLPTKHIGKRFLTLRRHL